MSNNAFNSEKDRQYLIRYYGNRIYDGRFLSGWEGDLIEPGKITEDELNLIFAYFRRNEDQNEHFGHSNYSYNSMDNWEVDNYAAFIGVKTLAFTECNHFPLPGRNVKENNEINNYNYYMRHAISKLGMKKLVLSKDRGNIYYMPEYWKYACILYMYYTPGYLPKSTVEDINFIKEEFKGILLGHNLESIALLCIETDACVLGISDFRYKRLSHFRKKEIYEIVYNSYITRLSHMEKRYDIANEIILNIENKLTPRHKIACLGLNVFDHSIK